MREPMLGDWKLVGIRFLPPGFLCGFSKPVSGSISGPAAITGTGPFGPAANIGALKSDGLPRNLQRRGIMSAGIKALGTLWGRRRRLQELHRPWFFPF